MGVQGGNIKNSPYREILLLEKLHEWIGGASCGILEMIIYPI